MKLFIIVLERKLATGILFARTHYDTNIELKSKSVEVSRRVFANRAKAHKYLKELRKEYSITNLTIDPTYIHPTKSDHPSTYRPAKARMVVPAGEASESR